MKSGKSEYLVDGITSNDAIEGLPAKSESSQNNLSDKVIIRTIQVDNITGLRFNGMSYTV